MRIEESFYSLSFQLFTHFLIAQSNFHAKGFSLCFNFSYKTTQHIIGVNSWNMTVSSLLFQIQACLSELSH